MKENDLHFLPKEIQNRKDLDLRAGDTVRVSVKIKEKDKFRIQVFEGLVLARKHGREPGATFTVRKISNGVGVERIFPLYSPMIDSIEITRRSRVRRSKLYYLRDVVARKIRNKLRKITNFSTSSKDLDPVELIASKEGENIEEQRKENMSEDVIEEKEDNSTEKDKEEEDKESEKEEKVEDKISDVESEKKE